MLVVLTALTPPDDPAFSRLATLPIKGRDGACDSAGVSIPPPGGEVGVRVRARRVGGCVNLAGCR